MDVFKQVKMFIRIVLCITIFIQFLCDPVQTQGDDMVSCRSTISCNANGDDEVGIMTASECCVENPDGLSYINVSNQTGVQTCTVCIVFGFFQDFYVGMEQRSGNHLVQVGYQKGAVQVKRNLVFNIHDSPGTATRKDYTITTQRARALHHAPDTPDNVVLYFNVDNIAQEMNETMTLNLTPIDGIDLPTGNGVFFRNNITIIITDNDTLEVSFTESDYRANERDRSMPVKVIKNALIATAVELEVIPLTIQQSKAIIPSSLRDGIPINNSYSPPFADVADFNSTTITITFDPDEDWGHDELSVPIPIIDDCVDEANEQVFVIQLKVVGGANVNSITITRRVSLCRITDDDDIRIGFERPSYTYTEPKYEEVIDTFFAPHSGSPVNGPIYLAKEGNRSSEQTFSVVVQIASASISSISGQNIQPATHNEDYRLSVSHTHVTLPFLPGDQRINVPFILFSDDIREGTEAFHLSSAPDVTLPEETRDTLPTYLYPIHLFTDTLIIIEEATTEQEITTTSSIDLISTSSPDDTTTTATTEPGGTTTTTMTLTTDFTDTTDDVTFLTTYTGSGSYDQSTANTDMGETPTTDIEASTTDTEQSTTASNTTVTVNSTFEGGSASPSIFRCSVFTKELKTILNSTMESQKLDQHSISMAIKQLAEVITGAEIDGCSSEQISKNLNVISDIISNVALYVLNQPSSEEFDNTIVYGSTQIVNSLLQWPTAAVVVEASSRLVRSFEIISSIYARQLSINDVQNFTFPSITLVTQLSTTDELKEIGKSFSIGDATTFTITENTLRGISSLDTTSSSFSEKMNSSIHLPGSLFQQIDRSINMTGLVFTLYRTSALFPVNEQARNSSMTEVGTHIIAANINGQDVEGLVEPVIITLQLNIREGVFLMPGSEMCVSWDFNLRDWTNRGCKTSVGPNGTITCSCSHLTNFAVLMDVCLRQEDCKPVNKHVDTVLSYISYIGIAISIVGLLLTIITMLAFKKVRQRETSKYHVQLCIALLLMLVMALVLVATSAQAVDLLYGGCVFISIFVHYFALVAVMWMGAEALLMLQKVVIIFVRITTKYIVILSLVCWLAPTVPVLISLIADLSTGHDPGNDIIVKRTGDNSFCFLSHPGAFWGAFLAPILLIIIFNIIAFICVIFVLVRQVRRRSKATTANEDAQKMGYKKIIFLMIRISGVMALFGLTWLFAILTVVSVTGLQEMFQILFTIFNSFQGCFIFIFLCVLDQKVRESWKRIYDKVSSRLLPEKLKPAKKHPRSDLESATNGTALHTRYSFISSRQATLTSLNGLEGVCTDNTLA